MTIHIGYPTLNDFTKAVDWLKPVYAALVTQPGSADKYGLRQDHHYLTLAQPVPAEDAVRYWRYKAGGVMLINGQPFEADRAHQDVARSKSAYDCITAWLEANDFTIIHGVIAFPRDLMLLDGDADILAYDRDADRYYLLETANA